MSAVPRAGHHYIDETCIGCGACEHACPLHVDAIYSVEGDFLGRFAIEPQACIDCGICIPLCPILSIHDTRQAARASTAGGYTSIRELQQWAVAKAR